MTNSYNNRYWKEEFAVTQADMDRLEIYIAQTEQAHELTGLAKRIIRGRLRHGDEISPAVLGIRHDAPERSVRLWDPTVQWQVGDHTIVAVSSWHNRQWGSPAPYIGEVVAVVNPYVKIYIDALGESRSYTMSASQKELSRWREVLQNLVADKRKADDQESDVELILLEYGERVTSQLFNALRADERFVRLSGRWFLRRLAHSPSEAQLSALAWAMLDLSEPKSTEDLLPLLLAPAHEGDPGLFGLYLAMQSRPELFVNADPGQRPRWRLIGPPPGPATAQYAAYDPESYVVLCEPGERIEVNVAKRLWELKLFPTICRPQG